jgi:hypothetical protein
LLQNAGFDLAVVDCHPGLALMSQTVRDLVDANIYVTTPNRSDCFGLLKAAFLRKLDKPNAILVINKAEPPVLARASLTDTMKRDQVIGPAGKKGPLSQLKYLGVNKKHMALLPESEDFRSCFALGSSGFVPTIRARSAELDFLRKIDALLDGAG